MGLIGYSFESCEKKIFKKLKEHSPNIPEITKNIGEEFGEIDFQHKFIFIQALVSAVCRSRLNLNIESKFKSLCSLLSIYIDGSELFELAAFIAIKLLQHKLEYQKGKKLFEFFDFICYKE